MAYRRRIFFTDKQKSEIWNLWLRGESMSSIGRGFERASSSIYPLLARTGGIRPPDRTRSRLALTLGEREEISRCLIANIHCGQLPAPCGGQPPRSAVTSGAGGGTLRYRAVHADAAAWGRAHRPKPFKLAGNAYLCREISAKLIRKGLRNKLQAGSCASIRAMTPNVSLMKRSIGACSSSHVAC
jgi:hypothetical protein